MRGWRFVVVMVVLCLVSRSSLGAAPTLSQVERDAGWALLFNGHDLTGWTMSGGNPEAWAVNGDNELFVAKPGEGWWLRTDRMYRDFELTLDFFLPPGANSGVGVRGSSDGDPAFTGMEIQILDTHGQEPDVHNCGAVYEAIAPSAMAVNPPGQWNTYRIMLIGDTLNVWLNGVRIHAGQKIDSRGYFRSPESPLPMNKRATTGYIALQDHGHAVRFRNIKIRDLSTDPEPSGMTPVVLNDSMMRKGGGSWEGSGRTIIGRDGPGHLFTDELPGDIEIRALVKVSVEGNSGLYFRTVPNKDNPDSWPTGYEAQVDNDDPVNFTGCIYDRAHTAPPYEGRGCITRDEVWFDYRIRAEGNHIRTWINGIPVVDALLDQFDSGRIALQTHNPGSVIEYRDLRWIEIKPE